mmetsp:Transcript_43574/g.125975  ORF Transcript_43574/g.125975 Transcript_43574/m.125975 type:complete len:343 (+) Transcript_43574:66-1094(+)
MGIGLHSLARASLLACWGVGHAERAALRLDDAAAADVAMAPSRRSLLLTLASVGGALGEVGVEEGPAALDLRRDGPWRVLRMFDSNGDGRISGKEFMGSILVPLTKYVSGGGAFGGGGGGGDEAEGPFAWWERLFKKADIDNDGTLTGPEAMYMLELARNILESADNPEFENAWRDEVGALSVYSVFVDLDSDEDGFIGPDEFKAALAQTITFSQVSDAERKLMFARADVDDDRRLSLEEFQFATFLVQRQPAVWAWSEKRFILDMMKGLDRDGNKQISLAELGMARRIEKAFSSPQQPSFIEVVWTHLDNFDLNDDGALDLGEVAAFARQVRSLADVQETR